MDYHPSENSIPDKIDREIIQVIAVSVLMYGCTTWTPKKRFEKKLEGDYKRALCAVLNESC